MATRKLKRSRDSADFGDADDGGNHDGRYGAVSVPGLSNGLANDMGGGVYGSGFAADRTNNHENKRQRLSAPVPSASSSESTIAASASSASSVSGSGNSTLRDDHDWSTASGSGEPPTSKGWVGGSDRMKPLKQTTLFPAVASSSAHSGGAVSGQSDYKPPTPSSPLSGSPAPSGSASPAQVQKNGSPIGAFLHATTPVRIRRSNDASPIARTEVDSSDEEGDDEEDAEDYDPDEVALDVGDASDSENEDDGEKENHSAREPARETQTQQQQQPLSGMNAFLHELHFAHRSQRPAPAPPPPRLPSPALATTKRHIIVSTVNGSPVKHFPSLSSPLTTSTSTGVVPPNPSIAEAVRAAARRREALQKQNEAAAAKEVATRASPAAQQRPIPDEEKSTVGAQYEETNRLLGALFLSRRRQTGAGLDDEDEEL